MPEDKNKKTPAPEKKEGGVELTFRIRVTPEGGGRVLFAQGTDNHYTGHGFDSDTCCSCTT
jgi:hypothetical protein